MNFYSSLLTIFFSISIANANNNIGKESYCVIRNEEYEKEYLYLDDATMKKVFTSPVSDELIQDFTQMEWLIISTSLNDSFYIMNSASNELLCASKHHLDLFKLRRKLDMIQLSEDNFNIVAEENKNGHFDECIWKFQEIQKRNKKFGLKTKDNDDLFNGKGKIYVIWSVKYKEPLYAGSFLLKNRIVGKRNVYTWHKKPDTFQFIWHVYCNEN
jgi:hypothetical protein